MGLALETEADGAGDAAGVETSGRVFGPYRLIEKIGEGGMGIVWLARQEHPIRRDVALKVVKPGADSARVLSRFDSERQALAILNHPHIATVFDAGLGDDGRPYFAMEYVAGLPITAFADQHALPIPARLELFLQVCEAVEHAHQKGVLHRDLKPANILVSDRDGRGIVKVIDFGVAKALGPSLSADTMETQVGSLVGTPEYMSPEQAGLTEAAVDTRTDIYSLGLVLYELLVGALPFDAVELRRKAVLEMLRVIREDEPPRLASRLTHQSDAEIKEIARRRLTEPRALVRQLRGDLEWITNRALEKEPARRYASASELRSDVRRHLANEPVVAGPPDLQYRLGKLMRRHRGASIGAGVAIAALVAGAVVSSVMWIGAERARRENRQRLKVLHATTGLELASDDQDLRALPWLVRALQLEEGGPRAEEVHRIRIGHVLDGVPHPVRIWRHEGLVGAFLAPDRQTLATWDLDGTVKLWDPSDGRSVANPLPHPAPIVDLRLGAGRVVTVDDRGAVRVWDIGTGREAMPSIVQGSPVHLVRMSATANRFLTADRAGGIAVRSLDTGRVITSLRVEGATFAEFLDEGRAIAVAGRDGLLRIVDSDSGRSVAQLRCDDELVDVTRLDANTVATTVRSGIIQTWDLATGTPRSERTPMIPNGANSVRVSVDRTSAFLCGLDGPVRAVLGRPGPPARLGSATNCLSLDLSDDGAFVSAGHADGAVRVWNVLGEPLTAALPHAAAVPFVGFLRESRRLLTADREGMVRTWELTPAVRSTWPSTLYTWDSVFSPDGRRIALASGAASPPYTGQATVLDSVTGEVLLPPLRHGASVRCVSYTPDGKLIATSSMDGSARLWDAASGEPVSGELRHTAGPLQILVFSPDGRKLLTFPTLDVPANVTLWEVPSGRRIATLPQTESALTGAFSPDGEHFVTVAPYTRQVQLWRLSAGQPVLRASWSPGSAAFFVSNSQLATAGTRGLELRNLDGTSSTASAGISQGSSIVASKDGRAVVLPTETGTIHVLNARDLSPRFPPLQLPGPITWAQISADNRWLVATSWDRRARVWSMETGEPLTPERRLPVLPLSVSFSPDSSRVQIGGRDTTVWDLKTELRPVETLERLSQLLSGHELLGTQLVALPADRLMALAADPSIAQDVPPGRERNWRTLIADNHLFQRSYSAAVAELAPIVTDPNTTWETHTTYAHALAELGRWGEAQRAFAAARGRRPDSTQLLYLETLTRAAGGEESAIDTACADAMRQFGNTRNPDRAHWLAKLCVLSTTLDDAARIRVHDLARMPAELEPDLGRHVGVHAAALIGAGDASSAEKLLVELFARDRVRERYDEMQLILAWAQRQLNRTAASAATVSRYDAVARTSVPWHRRYEAEAWRRRISGRQ